MKKLFNQVLEITKNEQYNFEYDNTASEYTDYYSILDEETTRFYLKVIYKKDQVEDEPFIAEACLEDCETDEEEELTEAEVLELLKYRTD